jgi:voltage-gated potassium channel
VEELLLSSDPQHLGELNGRSLAELQLGRRSGALVLAIRNPPGAGSPETALLANPSGEVRLAPGQLLVVMGSQEQLERLTDLLGSALAGVDTLQA